MEDLSAMFSETSTLISIVSILIYLPVGSVLSVPLPLHPCILCYFWLLTPAILTGVRWNLNIILICLQLMAKDIEHFFMYLLAINISTVENC
jgi:hypothetical protein